MKALEIAPTNQPLIQRRNASIFSQSPFKDTKFRDNLPEDFVLIYSNQNAKSYAYSIIFIGVGLGSAFYYVNKYDLWKSRDDSTYYPVVVLSVISLCTIWLYIVLRCSMHRIYKNMKTGQFVGVRPRWILFKEKFTFQLSDTVTNTAKSSLKVPNIFRVDNNYISGNLKIKNRPYVLSGNDFAAPKFYNEIHGYVDVKIKQ